ncbi:MAG: hypothetical protein IPM57_06685 [Oligoflexia bacterium]|nr:hypothetical protein [Oligoflexia bacterium]
MMFRISLWLVTIVALGFLFLVLTYRFDNYMYAWQARLSWGGKPFDGLEFQTASINKKAAMVADIISNKRFIGKSIEQVKIELGAPTGGYFNYDTNLTYTIYVSGETIWELVLVTSHETGVVQRVLIYKRCCSVTKKIIGILTK